jgi:hypothetical protein
MSLQDRSILINISLHSFGQSRKDSSVTSKVLLDNSADGDSGSWSTNLLPKEAYKSISQLDSQIRKCHKDNTLPWSDKGSRILPSENFDNYMAQIRSFRRQREELVETFRRLYPTYLNAARAKRGVLFNPAHYPTDEQAAAQYDFVLNATPVPHENDFRCTLGSPADLAKIKSELSSKVKDAEQNAAIELFQRIAAPLAAMVERLSDPDAKFKDTLVGNLEEITDLIPSLNITDNHHLTQLHSTIKTQLAHYTPDALRNSPADRTAAATKAQAILSQAAAWMNPA